jgi:plastocyanin
VPAAGTDPAARAYMSRESIERSGQMVKRALAVGVFAVLALSLWAPVASAGGGCHGGLFVDAKGVKVDLRDLCFTPTVIRVQPGQSVTWTNRDDTAHTVTGVAGQWGAYDELGLNDTVTYRFQNSGVFPYFCLIHPGMVGAVVVGDGTSKETTTQAVVPVVPTTAAPAPQTAAAPQHVPAVSTSEGVSSLWRILAIAAFVLIGLALAGLAAQRAVTRRGTVKA